MTELPHGWCTVRVGDALSVTYGKALDKSRREVDGQFHYVGSGGSIARTQDRLTSCETIVVGRKGTAGSVQRFPDGCWPSDTTFYMEVPDGLSGALVEHQLRAAQLGQHDRSTALPGLVRPDLEAAALVVPPTAEQERIVTAIEEAFSKLDAGEAGLRAVRLRLKRMREAVLAAAVTGRLVSQDPTDTPATKVLAELGAQPLREDTLAALPAGWVWAALDSLNDPARPICYGILKPGPSVSEGVPYVEVRSLRTGRIEPEHLPRSHPDIERGFVRSRLRPADLTIAIRGTTGRVAIVPPTFVGGNVSRDCARLAVIGMDPRYAETFLRGPSAQRFFAASIRGVAVKGINIGDLRRLPVAVPPVEEQHRIVSEVERQMSFIEACERAADAGLARSTALRRSVLKAAFEGRLVPQNPTDEPASVLLERIRDERAASAGRSDGRRRKKVGAS